MMSIFFGTAQSYASKQALLTKWNMKKSGQEMMQTKGNLTVDMGNLTKDAQKQARLQSIKGKLKAGMRLSIEELSYLKTNSPETYKKVMDIERERDAYKEKLKECKTKDDVAALQVETLGAIANQVQSVSNNPNIPLSAKLAIAEEIQMKTGAISDEHRTFVASGDYQKLKWEYELNEEEKKAKKATQKDVPEIAEEEKEPIKDNQEIESAGGGDFVPPLETPETTEKGELTDTATTSQPTVTSPTTVDISIPNTTTVTPTISAQAGESQPAIHKPFVARA